MHSTASVLKLVMTVVATMMMTSDYGEINGDDDDYDHGKLWQCDDYNHDHWSQYCASSSLGQWPVLRVSSNWWWQALPVPFTTPVLLAVHIFNSKIEQPAYPSKGNSPSNTIDQYHQVFLSMAQPVRFYVLEKVFSNTDLAHILFLSLDMWGQELVWEQFMGRKLFMVYPVSDDLQMYPDECMK